MSNCNPSYKNLNRIQSFSEQKYATVQLFEQICSNDEYLKQKVDELEYLTPPAVRKRFNPLPIDKDASYSYNETSENEIIFDTNISKSITIDFSDDNLIDRDKSTAVIEHFVDGGTIIHKAMLPKIPGTVDKSVKNWTNNNQINTHWYVGFDKNETYTIRPNWIKDPKLLEIPSVCRAQTFTIPSGKGGKLEAVSIHLANNGTVWGSWGSPLIVQIWKTKKVTSPAMTWDPKTKTNVPTGGTETIAVPDGNPYTAIAEATFEPSKIEPGLVSIAFPQPPTLFENESYALVFLSPLSNWSHCPRIGGWGRNCANSKYMQGDAFFSNNNARTWERYGRNDLKVDYYLGRYIPSDFAFQLNIRQEGTLATGDHYLYLKPIHTSPFKKVILSCNDHGDAADDGSHILYQISEDGRTWHNLTNHEYTFPADADGNYPETLFVRAKMWLTTPNQGVSPSIEDMTIDFINVLPKKMYVRTHFYNPKVSPMLGASLWGRIFAPVKVDPTCDCKIEVIQEKQVIDHFQIITAKELSEYTWITELDSEKITDEDLEVRYHYLIDDPYAIEILREHKVYVKPWIDNEGGEDEVEYGLSFWSLNEDEEKVYTPFYLKNSPAYPILECQVQPSGDEGVCNYGEWYDFIVDYDNDGVILAEDLIDPSNETTGVPVGSITFTYNPVFIQDLTQSEVGMIPNGVNGYIDKPLVIDYFKQNFEINNEMLETRQVALRVSPVDPLRSVILNKDTDNEQELIEDTDFTVDYTKGLLIFNIVNDETNGTILNLNDNLEVVYTPNLEDTGIALGYTCTRGDNTDKQVRILPNWIEYKV